MIISLTGKGGSGKTALASLLLKAAIDTGFRRILAIDADSSMGLPYALGVSVGKTVSEVRERIIKEPGRRREVFDLPVEEVVSEALQPGPPFDLLVMGRSEGPGCYCGINDLLKYGIDALSKNYDITIIDGEAGPEQVSRRVVSSVDALIIVSDTSQRGLHTAEIIWDIASKGRLVGGARLGLVINRFKQETASLVAQAQQMGMEVWGCLPMDEGLAQSDDHGHPLINLPNTSPAYLAARELLRYLQT